MAVDIFLTTIIVFDRKSTPLNRTRQIRNYEIFPPPPLPIPRNSSRSSINGRNFFFPRPVVDQLRTTIVRLRFSIFGPHFLRLPGCEERERCLICFPDKFRIAVEQNIDNRPPSTDRVFRWREAKKKNIFTRHYYP